MPPLTKCFLDVCFSCSLEQLISIPTRVNSNTATLKSHVLNNSSQKVSQCGAIELGITDHDLVYCTRKTPSLKPNKHNEMSIRSIKNYTKAKLLELLRKTDLPDYTTFTCLKKAYQDFIFKLREVIDLLCPSKKFRLKANSTPWTLKQFQQFVGGINFSKNTKNLVSKQTMIISNERMLIIVKNYGKLVSPLE